MFRSGKRKIEENLIEEIVNRCNNHPRFVQEFFHELWIEENIDFEIIDKTERNILTKRVPEFAYVWDALSLNQKKAMKLLAGTLGKNIFSADNLTRFGFRGASQVTAALSALEKTGVISKNGKWIIQDPFFEKWLQLNIGNIRLVNFTGVGNLH